MNLPNKLTVGRLLIVPVVIITILYRDRNGVFGGHLPLMVFILAAVTDAIDGFIARHFKLKTPLGTFLDPLADKTLILATLISLHYASSFRIQMPLWALVIIASRDGVIMLWLVVSYMNQIPIHIKPNILGKATTFFQMVTIMVLLMEYPAALYIWDITIVLTILSMISYVIRETRKIQDINTTH